MFEISKFELIQNETLELENNFELIHPANFVSLMGMKSYEIFVTNTF
jgi:hypothetical protein